MNRKLLLLVATTVPVAALAAPPMKESTAYWQQQGQDAIARALTVQANTGRAKNVILFVGDGNGIASVTATRIFDGQSKGMSGEENILSFERFPYLALAKTYNTNQQTADSAGTMTAIMTGVKTQAGVLSLGPEISHGDCADSRDHILPTLLEQVRERGYATGVITTTRITHATPGATYAHVANRDWEGDSEIPAEMKDCAVDIARQLVENGTIDVAMGGGRQYFLPMNVADPEYPKRTGKRSDGRNLVADWQRAQPQGKYLWNQEEFNQLPGDYAGPVLALFEPSHMSYEADRSEKKAREPSLAEMTAKAIDLLNNRDKGFFLMVEAGRIDHAHHAGNASRALVEGQMLSQAVQTAMAATSPDDTLIIVTADHSHVLTMAGYPTRGNPILGLVKGNDERGKPTGKPYLAVDGKPYTTLGYINGPGHGHFTSEDARYAGGVNAGRKVTAADDTASKHYHQESLVPMYSESHGGEDVAIYARGPWAHLIHGVQEQNYIYHVMRYALGLDEQES